MERCFLSSGNSVIQLMHAYGLAACQLRLQIYIYTLLVLNFWGEEICLFTVALILTVQLEDMQSVVRYASIERCHVITVSHSVPGLEIGCLQIMFQ